MENKNHQGGDKDTRSEAGHEPRRGGPFNSLTCTTRFSASEVVLSDLDMRRDVLKMATVVAETVNCKIVCVVLR